MIRFFIWLFNIAYYIYRTICKFINIKLIIIILIIIVIIIIIIIKIIIIIIRVTIKS